MSTQSKVYSLFPPHTNIRLLCVFPGRKGDTIKAELFFADVNTAYYEALSYMWGEEGLQSSIILNEEQTPFLIRKNLHDFLQQYRSLEETKVIWIDAICINQDDVMERNAQVRQMHKVYSNCFFLNIWLGPSNADSDRGMSYLRMKKHHNLPNLEDEAVFLGLHAIMDNPYWNRTWAMPEVMLNKPLYPWRGVTNAFRIRILCGSSQIRWVHFSRFWEAFDKRYGSSSDELGMHLELRVSKAYPVWAQRRQPVSDKLDLAQVIRDNCWTSCSDPRDKVYALVSLTYTTVRPDYNIASRELFWRVVRDCCEQHCPEEVGDFILILIRVLDIGPCCWVCRVCGKICTKAEDEAINRVIARSRMARPLPLLAVDSRGRDIEKAMEMILPEKLMDRLLVNLLDDADCSAWLRANAMRVEKSCLTLGHNCQPIELSISIKGEIT